jgi:hypothetical protein
MPCNGLTSREVETLAQRSVRTYWAVVDGKLRPMVKTTRERPLPTVMVVRQDDGTEVARYSTDDELRTRGLMPERDQNFIEAECLEMARGALGCSDLRAVRIGPSEPGDGGPNWEVLGFTPDLPLIARSEALNAIAELRQTYALSWVQPPQPPPWRGREVQAGGRPQSPLISVCRSYGSACHLGGPLPCPRADRFHSSRADDDDATLIDPVPFDAAAAPGPLFVS